MGLLDDAASVISGAPSRKHRSSKHRSSRSERHRSRSRSRSPGFAASIFGGNEGSHHHKKKSSRSERHRSRSRSRSPGFAASIFGAGDNSPHHNASRSSFFNMGNASRGSFFGLGGGGGGNGRSPSYYKRSPRKNFMQRAYKKLKRLIRDLVHYAKRHPMKVFMLVIMPLITGGALTALLARFGLRMPPALENMLGLGAKAMSGDSIGLVGEAVRMASAGGAGAAAVSVAKGWGSDGHWEKRTVEGSGDSDFVSSALGSLGGLAGGGGSSSSGWMGSITKMFS